jgi:hypothetical protein
MYGASFSHSTSQRLFPRWLLVGETPHISVQLRLAYELRPVHCIIHARVLNRVWCIVTQQYVPVLQVLVQYVLSTYILLVYQSLTLRGLIPAVSLIYVSLSEGHTLLCGSRRLHLFPYSLYYSPPLVIVYKLTITTITSSFTSCDATK